MADNKAVAKKVIDALGGSKNIKFVTHCITRLRFTLVDDQVPNDEQVKSIDGVVGVNRAGQQYQVIIGTHVADVFKEVQRMIGDKEEVETKPKKESMSLKGIGTIVLDYLSGSLMPAIPVMLAAAIFKMLAALCGPNMLNIISENSDLYTLFTFVGDAGFYFFPVLIGYTASKKFGLNPVMGIFFGAILIHPTVVDMATKGMSFSVFGIPAQLQNYSSTIIPIILTVWVASYIERLFKKYIPSSLRVMGVPVGTTVVTLPLMLCILGPIGGFLGKYICTGILAFGNIFGPLGVLVIGALWEFLVMTGMHQVMISQMVLLFAENGCDPVVSLGAASASMAVAGMCLGYWLATKDKDKKSLALTNAIAALIGGVTEPGLYGTGLVNKKPLFGMIVGGGVGALYASLFGVKAYNMVPVSSFLCLTGYAGGTNANFIHGIISGIIALLLAAIVTYILCRDKKSLKTNEEVVIFSPMNGELKELKDVQDPTFAEEMMGKGFAILPKEGKLYAPIDGTIVSVFPTKHAICMTNSQGLELLIHMGLDTVSLNGEGFDIKVKDGDIVKKGQLIAEFNIDQIKESYDVITPIVITNSNAYKDFTKATKKEVSIGDQVLVIKK